MDSQGRGRPQDTKYYRLQDVFKLTRKRFVDVNVSANMSKVLSSDVVVRATIEASTASATRPEDFEPRIAFKVTQSYEDQEKSARVRSGA